MAVTAASRRSLQAFAVLLVSALLLLLSTFCGLLNPNHGLNQNSLVNRQLPIEPVHAFTTRNARSVGLPFGRQDFALNFSSSIVDPPLLKRAPLPEPRGYRNLICEGGKYLEAIKAAFEGKTPSKHVPLEELDNGWTKSSVTDDEDFAGVERRWKSVFESLFGKERGYPPQDQIKAVNLIQDKRYQTNLDVWIETPTMAYSYGFYYPNRNLMMSTSSYSAATRITNRNQGIPKDERNQKLPTINALSDLMWLAWNTAAPSAPKELRYIARDTIYNEETQAVMDYLFSRDKQETRNVPWPGLEYAGDSNEGKALLATPNGRATAWLLIDHAQELEWRLTTRQLKVNIFSVLGDYCMLWDMEPQSPRRRSERTDHVKYHVKRASVDDFNHNKDQGDTAYNQMEAAFEGCETPVQDFNSAAIDNGWRRAKDSKYPPERTWQHAFETLVGKDKVPTQETSFYVQLHQDKDFTNKQGQVVKVVPNRAVYEQYLMPSTSAILVANMRSPFSEVKSRYEMSGQPAPSSQEIVDKYIPPLNRWSDIIWTLWKEKGGDSNLRYIAHDFIANPQTESVMDYIRDKAGKTADDLPFPGLEFGMDSAEGRALLGTPNGIGTARILIDRASTWGRREPRVHIFWPEDDYPCILWDMKPSQVQSRALPKRRIEPSESESRVSVKRHKKTHLRSRALAKRHDNIQLQSPALAKVHVEFSQSQPLALSQRHEEPLSLLRRALNGSLVRRDTAADYHKAVCTGQGMWAKIAAAFNRHGGDPVQYFLPSALDNGWTRKDENMDLYDDWPRYFNRKLGRGKLPPKDQTWYVRLFQDKDFKNSHGEDIADFSGTVEAGTALYFAYYIPKISAVVVKNMVSPANVLKKGFRSQGWEIPSNDEIAAYETPPLSRWSDVTWTVYQDLSKNRKNLRYIGQDHVNNKFTAGVMVYIFIRRGKPAGVPFPGLEFGMDSEEGQALLGTPNGMGTAWLLLDRLRELGRRNPRVSIWVFGGELMMAWDMAPA
ncbi:MAG: hypothetical protein Q9166_002565 [cf. Caloplaca sp. 2 TL-2023]